MPQLPLTLATLTIALVIVSGCANKTSKANTSLRKDKQSLKDRVTSLQRQHDADAASITAYQKSDGSLKTLSPSELAQLFTVHGIKLNRLTGGDETDAAKPGDDGLKVYLVPTDEQAQPIKAVGDVTIEAFAEGNPQAIQTWNFSREQVKASWLGTGLLYEFVLTCPFEKSPSQSKLNLRVTFTDALTGRAFSADKSVTIKTG